MNQKLYATLKTSKNNENTTKERKIFINTTNNKKSSYALFKK